MQSLANQSQSDYYFANGSAGLGISKDTSWTPTAITTALWLDASDASTITIATGVSQWNDKSGNGRNATQATGASQPLVISAAQNGLNVIRFDGSNDKLSYNGSFFVGTSYSVHTVVARRSGKSNNYYMSGSDVVTNTNLVIGWSADTYLYAQYGNDISTSDTYSTPTAGIWGMLLNTASGRLLFKDGTQVASSGTTTTLSSYTGANLGNFLASDYYNGDIAEVVVTTTALSTTDRQKMEGYLAWKWGLQASLPADHPYKNQRPGL